MMTLIVGTLCVTLAVTGVLSLKLRTARRAAEAAEMRERQLAGAIDDARGAAIRATVRTSAILDAALYGIVTRDGREIPVELAIHAVQSADEDSFSAFLRDATEGRRAESGLRAAKDEAEAASRAKSAFLALMSHEIRTPMNAVLGLMELLTLTKLDSEQRETVGLALESSRSLLRLIDDILDFSKIEAGKLDLQNDTVDLRALIADAAHVYAGLAAAQGLDVTSEVDAAVPERLQLDPLRFRQVLGNFLSNAIKFARAGSIRITVGVEGAGREHLRVAVIDSGPGMDAATLARIGEPFVQGDAHSARGGNGTGLGLAICRRLASIMGGALVIESVAGRGTTATLTIPLVVAATDAPLNRHTSTQALRIARSAHDALDSAPVLFVDDQPINRRLLSAQLSWLGCEPATAADGLEALGLLEACADAGRPFAVIITDCQMPGMDGYELTREIRRREAARGWAHTPILAFTADTLAESQAECLAAGMSGILTKPVELEKLRTALSMWIRVTSQPAPAAEPAQLSGGTVAARYDFLDGWQDPLLEEFCGSHSEDLAVLETAVRARDGVAAARAAHRIKGAARMLGATELSGLAGRIERGINDGAWQTVAAPIQEMHVETERLYAAMATCAERRRAS